MSTSGAPDSQQVLTRFGGMAAAVVAVAALLFLAIGAVSGDDAATPNGGGNQPGAGQSGAPQPNAGNNNGSEGGQGQNQGQGQGNNDGQDTGPAEASEDPSGEIVNPSDRPTGPNASATTAPPANQVPVGQISVQVLDGILDGGTTASDLAATFESEGYEDVFYYGPSSSEYPQTTVFYSQGSQDAANQVANANGWDVVRPASDVGLSDSADIHVVVGADAQ